MAPDALQTPPRPPDMEPDTLRTVRPLATEPNPLATLLDPVGPDRFFAEYWDKAAVHLPGTPARLEDLPGIEEVPSLVAGSMTDDGWTTPDVTVRGSFVDRAGAVREIGVVPTSMLGPLYNAGVSLCFPSLGTHDRRIKRYIQDIKHCLTWPGEITLTAYLTPPQSGSELHFDSQHVFMLQRAGEKLWRVSTTPAIAAPPNNMTAAALDEKAVQELLRRRNLSVIPPEELEFAEITLRPGDVLYLPPGTWHEPRTTERSFHYSLTLFPVSISQMLSTALRTLLTQDEPWRRDLRFSEGEETSEERILSLIADALRRLGSQLSTMDPETVLRRIFPAARLPASR